LLDARRSAKRFSCSIIVVSSSRRDNALAGGSDLSFQRVDIRDQRHEPLLQRPLTDAS
jgi:hypothetical protein